MAQYEIGIGTSTNFAGRWSNSNPNMNYHYRFGYEIGGFYKQQLSQKLHLRTELNFTILRYRENETFFNGNIIRDIAIAYFTLPIYCGFSFKKFSFLIGVQSMFGTGNGSKFVHFEYLDGSVTSPYKDFWGANWFDFGPKLGLNWTANRLSLQSTFYHSLLDSGFSSTGGIFWNYLSFGISYALFKGEANSD